MGENQIETQDILALIQTVDEHKLTELKLDDGNVELSLRKKEASQIVNVTGSGFQGASAWFTADVAAISAVGTATARMPMIDVSGGTGATEAVAGGISGEGLNGATGTDSDKVINSPLVGTFCNAATLESEPSMKIGDTMRKGQVMGVTEAMRLMNEIECEFDGVVEVVLVNNEDVVEYGQPLLRIH